MSKRMMTAMAGLLGMFALTLGSAAPAGAAVLDGSMTVFEGPLQTGTPATVGDISHADCVLLPTNLTGYLSVDNDSNHVVKFFADNECAVEVGEVAAQGTETFTGAARRYQFVS